MKRQLTSSFLFSILMIRGYLAGGFWLAVSIWGYLAYAQKHNVEKRSHAS